MKAIRSAFLLSLFCLSQTIAAETTIQFIDKIGEFSISGMKETIKITRTADHVQFRIRGSGPAEPAIHAESGWFIAVVDKDHFWVHLGGGRLFYYSWSYPHARIDEWTYPKLGNVKPPPEVEARLKAITSKAVEPSR